MHYKHRVPPQLIRISGTKIFFARFACEFTILYPHYGIQGAAPGMTHFDYQ